MINIWYSKNPPIEYIWNPEPYFNNTYEKEWFDDIFILKMIEVVDKTKYIGDGIFESSVLGKILPEQLSGGVKTLILIYKIDDKVFNFSKCGDNCLKFLLEMGDKTDKTVVVRHPLIFEDEDFPVKLMNKDKIIRNFVEWFDNTRGLLKEDDREIQHNIKK